MHNLNLADFVFPLWVNLHLFRFGCSMKILWRFFCFILAIFTRWSWTCVEIKHNFLCQMNETDAAQMKDHCSWKELETKQEVFSGKHHSVQAQRLCISADVLLSRTFKRLRTMNLSPRVRLSVPSSAKTEGGCLLLKWCHTLLCAVSQQCLKPCEFVGFFNTVFADHLHRLPDLAPCTCAPLSPDKVEVKFHSDKVEEPTLQIFFKLRCSEQDIPGTI